MSGRRLGPGSPLSGATLWLYDDITERRNTEEALRTANALIQAVFESAGVAIIATDTTGVIQLFNAAAERMLGYEAKELQYRETPALLHDAGEVVAYAAELSTELGQAVAPGFDVFCIKARHLGKDEREWTYICKDGRRFPVNLCVTALRTASGDISGYLGIATDISERQEAQRQIAHYDPVTSLPNRNLLRDRLDQALLQGKRDNESVVVMYLDLDRFKIINETLGHVVGDALLRQVAVRLSMALRTSDTLSRIGGDEFVIVLPGLSATSHVETIAQKLISFHFRINRAII
jgi:GGDEF domain-containing protein